MNNVYELDAQTGAIIERDYTSDEQTQREKDALKFAAIIKADKAKAKTKADVIAKLGLTADELSALLS